MHHRSALAIRHVGFENLGSFARPLSEAAYEVGYCDVCLDADDLAGADPDLAVILGAPIGVYEQEAYPFIAKELDFVRRRLDASRPTLGICFGSQLIAAALGGRVHPGSRKEIGWGAIARPPGVVGNPLEALGDLPVLHWHGDTFDLPAGCELLASTSAYRNQAFRQGHEVLAIQFHLEVEAGGFENWLVGHAVEVAQERLSARDLRRQAQESGPGLERAGPQVIADWLRSLP